MDSIELFAGAGGLGLGAVRAGFQPVSVVEIDSDCCHTLRNNSDISTLWPVLQSDIRRIDFSHHRGKIDIVTGGPPCQPFSLGGKHKGLNDGRDMFPEAIRVLREVEPKAFMFENVKGLTRQTFRNYFEYIKLQMVHPEVIIKENETWADHLARLEKYETKGTNYGLNYNVVVHLANAADYGVPQRRERVFFVGFRSDLKIAWSFPRETHSYEALAWSQYRDNTYWDKHKISWRERSFCERTRSTAWKNEEQPQLLPWNTVRDALSNLPDPEFNEIESAAYENHKFQAGARSYPGHTGSPLDSPAKTLKAGVHGVPGGENMLLRPNGTVRYFSIRESARLQTFPDNYVFHGSWTESMRQLGNAVPVKLAEVVASDILSHLKANNVKGTV